MSLSRCRTGCATVPYRRSHLARPCDVVFKTVVAILDDREACFEWLKEDPEASRETGTKPSDRQDDDPQKSKERVSRCHGSVR
jgi:hypothetical protein